MRDPYVEKLIYGLRHDGTVEYKDCPLIEGEQKDYQFRLSEDILHVKMLRHFSNVKEARRLVEPFLKAWENRAFLESGNDHLWFEFVDSVIIDLNPPDPNESQVIRLPSGVAVASGSSVKLTISKQEYPNPPEYVRFSPNAEMMIFRYRDYQENKEPLLSMAYFCLTIVEKKLGEGRKNAANRYNISCDVLNKLGELTSTRGTGTNARKYVSDMKDLNPKEQEWIDSAVRHIILQVAAVDAGKQQSILSMVDLPKL